MNESMAALDEMISAFVNIEYERVQELIKNALDLRVQPLDVLKGLQEGVSAVGKKYEEGEYFLSELMAAGEMMRSGLDMLRPYLASESPPSAGTVVIGTVRGDLHDIGKNLVKDLLQSLGFTVHDLGIDVSPEEFVIKVRNVDADILAMSTLLTTTLKEIGVVIKELEKSNFRDKVKVIVGGNAVTEEFGKSVGADAATKDAFLGVRICQAWMERRRHA